MPLRLKSLELHGYKTFAGKVNFEFAEGITAIVGPNGSGKSNIADALRWVLGEQSYSLLRAKKTEDMIFVGSEQRPRAGMASAVVTFDNSDGWLPVDFSEVALSRRAYRDGRNEYLLNHQHVRLKDINELLAQSGLSERTYTILGQGLVDASLALKADDRRALFEEAAGIGLYRSRREEALRRLETTQHNHDRVLDILAELEPRLKSLERQAARAQEAGEVPVGAVIVRAGRIIALSRNPARQALAREFGATDIVAERGDAAAEAVMAMTDDIGVDAALECVGTGQSMATAFAIARPGSIVGAIGAPHDIVVPIDTVIFRNVGLRGGVAPVRRYLPELLDDVLADRINPGRVFDFETDLEHVTDAYRAMDERRAVKSLVHVAPAR